MCIYPGNSSLDQVVYSVVLQVNKNPYQIQIYAIFRNSMLLDSRLYKHLYTLQQYLAMMGSSMEKFRESAQQSTDVAQMKKNYALCYYIIDAEGEAVTPQMVDEIIATGINAGVSRNFVEMMVVMAMAQNIVGKKATIK